MSIARRCRSFGVACRGADRGEISVRFADADIGASHREGFPFADHVALARGRFELDCRAGHQRAAPFLPSGKAWPVMERGPLEGLPGTILGAAFHGGSRQWLPIWAGWPRLGASLATKRVPVTLLATGMPAPHTDATARKAMRGRGYIILDQPSRGGPAAPCPRWGSLCGLRRWRKAPRESHEIHARGSGRKIACPCVPWPLCEQGVASIYISEGQLVPRLNNIISS